MGRGWGEKRLMRGQGGSAVGQRRTCAVTVKSVYEEPQEKQKQEKQITSRDNRRDVKSNSSKRTLLLPRHRASSEKRIGRRNRRTEKPFQSAKLLGSPAPRIRKRRTQRKKAGERGNQDQPSREGQMEAGALPSLNVLGVP